MEAIEFSVSVRVSGNERRVYVNGTWVYLVVRGDTLKNIATLSTATLKPANRGVLTNSEIELHLARKMGFNV